jgi:preprotein translocase subunit SecA
MPDLWRALWRSVRTYVQRKAFYYRAGLRRPASESTLDKIRRRRDELEHLTDDELRKQRVENQRDAFALAAVVCQRILGLRPHDVQIQGALAMAEGKIAEMQTGEGKTLAAVMAVYDYARTGEPVHVLTANDYLAQRDAEWMGPIYKFLGLTVGAVTQTSSPAERRAAYACDVTYATANEIGFDFLRDQLALQLEDLVLPEFSTALVDEADSIMIDEARIPLVIAGGAGEPEMLARRVAVLAQALTPHRDFQTDEFRRNVHLTNRGARAVEGAMGRENLYAPENLDLHAAVEAALHARILLRRDVDYLVRNGAIELVDEFKGRVAENRRWPAGLQTALEAKEGLPLRRQGRILGSITLQNLIRMYPRRCGMTGTAATESAEFRSFYGLEVVPIPTNRPVIRKDHPDAVFGNRRTKERAVVDAIAQMHAKGRPVLVGTASVAESERLSELVHAAGVPHQVLNARQDAEEASIVALAGQRGAVTISTNMAGRGTDIVLGEGVAELGGLHVIGTNRHESRRIDYQLRGRAGRQGDPGSSQFFLSTQDDLLTRYGLSNWTPDAEGVETVQRVVEGQNFEIRRTLWKYEGLIEMHRIQVHGRRRELLEQGADPHILSAIDSLWADHLANIGELREGIHFRSWGGREPLQEFLADASKMFDELLARIESIASGEEPVEETTRDATWTYLVSDYSLGTMDERFAKGVRRILRDKGFMTR